LGLAGQKTRVLVEQIGSVDAQRLGDLTGHLTPEEMWGIDHALATVLGRD
jgi:mRNA interferase MazF